LGAALATLAADRLAAENVPVAGVYTFGSPRVGDGAFARTFTDRLGDRCFRFVNAADVVTRVPPPGLILDYTHVGTPHHFGADGRVTVEAPEALPAPAPGPNAGIGEWVGHLFGGAARQIRAAVESVRTSTRGPAGAEDEVTGAEVRSLPAEVRGLLGELERWRQTAPLPPDFVDHTPARYARLAWHAYAGA
jgi:hypothetical protein